MTDVLDPAVASNDDVRRRHPQMKGGAQAAVVEHDRHGDPKPFAVGPDSLDGIVESDVDGDDGHIRSRCLVGMLEMRHLLSAGHAPGRPKFQVYRLLAVKTAEIDGVAVD